MDCENLIKGCSEICDAGATLLEQVRTINPDWEKLNYSRSGVSSLFSEFKRISAYSDWLGEQVIVLEHKRNLIATAMRSEVVSVEEATQRELVANAHNWINHGYASQERLLMASLKSGNRAINIKKIESWLVSVDECINLLKRRNKVFEDFKYKAQLLDKILNFGHMLQEIT